MGKTRTQLSFPGLRTAGSSDFTSPHYRTEVRIYPSRDRNPFASSRPLQAILFGGLSAQSQGEVIELTWDKHMGSASGQWSMKIRPNHASAFDLAFGEGVIVDGDWVDIRLIRNNVSIPICVGIVDTITRERMSAEGTTVVAYQITGRDHGAFFEYPITWASLFAQGLDELTNGLFASRIEGRVGGSPDELFRAIVEGTFKKGVGDTGGAQWELPPSLAQAIKGTNADTARSGRAQALIDILKIISFSGDPVASGKSAARKLRGYFANELSLWSVGEQTLHQTVMQWGNPLLNEIWYDLILPPHLVPPNQLAGYLPSATNAFDSGLRPEGQDPQGRAGILQGQLGAFIRERPFPTNRNGKDSLWFGLPTWQVPEWIVLSSTVTRTGHERYNVFELLADIGVGVTTEQPAFYAPLISREDIRARGLRSYQETTRYLADNGQLPDLANQRAEWLGIMRDWFGPNPHLFSGTATIKLLLPEIRLGQRIILEDHHAQRTEQYYVEGVSVRFQGPAQNRGAGGTTQLVLTRGFRGDDNELLSSLKGLPDYYGGPS